MYPLEQLHVKKSRKSPSDGDIIGLCGDWGAKEKTTVIWEIETKKSRYYVNEAGYETEVRVVVYGNGKYLRTTADVTSRNNLSNLPDC